MLNENRAVLLAPAAAGGAAASGSRSGGGSRTKPSSFTLDSETREVSSWSDLLVSVCLLMRECHPEDIERILEIRGRTLPYFSRVADELHVPRPIGETGIFASCQGAGALIAGRARRVVELFGYPAESLVIQTR